MSYKNQRNKNYDTVKPNQQVNRSSKFNIGDFDSSEDDDDDGDLSASITKFKYLVTIFDRSTEEDRVISVMASSEYDAANIVEEMNANYEILDVEEDDEIEDIEDIDDWSDLDEESVSDEDIDDDTPLSSIVRKFNRMSFDDDF